MACDYTLPPTSPFHSGFTIRAMKRSVPHIVGQFLRFAAVGLSAFAIDYVLFLVLTYVFKVFYLYASTASYVLSTIYNYALSMRYVFQGKETQTAMQQFFIFLGLSVVALGLNQLCLFLFVSYARWPEWFAKLAATFCAAIFNFVSRKLCLEDRSRTRRLGQQRR